MFKEQSSFNKVLLSIAGDFKEIDQDIAEIKENIEKYIHDFEYEVKEMLKDADKTSNRIKNIELQKILKENNCVFQKMIVSFSENSQKQVKQQKLRDKFSDSFIVFVLGKVKCGKSSLGNFIASSCVKPDFFTYDSNGEQQKSTKLEEINVVSCEKTGVFEVKATEATNSIQGFKVPGLTWVDSPGLHSLNGKNGDLAKSYVAAADLVLFLTASDSPCRASDLIEIIELVKNNNKSIVIIITRSDKVEEDEVNGVIVQELQAKSAEDRKAQEQWCHEEISKIKDIDPQRIFSDILSTSKFLADQAMVNKDIQIWQSSKLGSFYELMSKTLKSDGVRLKLEAPKDQIRSIVQLIVNGADELQQNIKSIKHRTVELRNSVKHEMKEIQFFIKGETVSIVDELFNDTTKSQKTKKITEKLSGLLQEQLKQKILPLFDKFNNEVSGLCDFNIKDEDFNSSDKFENRTIKGSYKNTGRGAGKATGAVSGAATGAWIGSLFGPIGTGFGAIAGGIAGAFAGGKAGEEIGDMIEFEKKISICVGNDRIEKIKNIKDVCNAQIAKIIEHLTSVIDSEYLSSLEYSVDTMDNAVENIKNKLHRTTKGL